MPGAEVTERVDDQNYKAKLTTAVGPILWIITTPRPARSARRGPAAGGGANALDDIRSTGAAPPRLAPASTRPHSKTAGSLA